MNSLMDTMSTLALMKRLQMLSHLQKKEYNSRNISEPECKKRRNDTLVTRPNSGSDPAIALNNRDLPVTENLNSGSYNDNHQLRFVDKVAPNFRGTGGNDRSFNFVVPQENQHTDSSAPTSRVASLSEKENVLTAFSNSVQSCPNQIDKRASSAGGKRRKATSKSVDLPSANLNRDRSSTEHLSMDEYQAWCEFATAAFQRMDAARARELMTLFTKHLLSPHLHEKKHADGYVEGDGSDVEVGELDVENSERDRPIYAARASLGLTDPLRNYTDVGSDKVNCGSSAVAGKTDKGSSCVEAACEQTDKLETEEALDQEAKEQIEKITLLKMEIESLQVEHNAKMAMYDKRFPCPAESHVTIEITNDNAPTAKHV